MPPGGPMHMNENFNYRLGIHVLFKPQNSCYPFIISNGEFVVWSIRLWAPIRFV